MVQPLLKLLLGGLILVPCSLQASDPILDWVALATKQVDQSEVSVWNPGLLPFDETEVRIESNHEQSLRVSLKPLGRMKNEFHLFSQRNRVLQLALQNMEQQRVFRAYGQILYLWRTMESVKVIENSESVFTIAKENLKSLQQAPDMDFDRTGFVSDLASFASLQTEQKSLYRNILSHIESTSVDSKDLIASVKSLELLSIDKIHQFLREIAEKQPPLQLEREQEQLKFYEFEKEKGEAYQLLKFFSISRREWSQQIEDYKFQISLRIPFLSDNDELDDARVDYILQKNKLQQAKIERAQELNQLKSELLGLIEKAKILQHLPAESYNKQKIAGSLSSIPLAAKNEANFMKAKLDFINTRQQIFEKYLFLLMLHEKLTLGPNNYLITAPQ